MQATRTPNAAQQQHSLSCFALSRRWIDAPPIVVITSSLLSRVELSVSTPDVGEVQPIWIEAKTSSRTARSCGVLLGKVPAPITSRVPSTSRTHICKWWLGPIAQ